MSKNSFEKIRKVKMEPDYINYAEGSVLIHMGNTIVLCNASVNEKLPEWLTGKERGWVTGEYSMLPRSTHQRKGREGWGGRWPSGRTQEISRMIGRALRGVIILENIPDIQITIDCDVLQADGGTRTASINGGFVALVIAVNKLFKEGKIKKIPVFNNFVAAVSVGINEEDQYIVDLDYNEDSTAKLDLNIVATSRREIVEIQGAGEHGVINKDQLNCMVDLGLDSIIELIEIQKETLRKSGINIDKLFFL